MRTPRIPIAKYSRALCVTCCMAFGLACVAPQHPVITPAELLPAGWPPSDIRCSLLPTQAPGEEWAWSGGVIVSGKTLDVTAEFLEDNTNIRASSSTRSGNQLFLDLRQLDSGEWHASARCFWGGHLPRGNWDRRAELRDVTGIVWLCTTPDYVRPAALQYSLSGNLGNRAIVLMGVIRLDRGPSSSRGGPGIIELNP